MSVCVVFFVEFSASKTEKTVEFDNLIITSDIEIDGCPIIELIIKYSVDTGVFGSNTVEVENMGF